MQGLKSRTAQSSNGRAARIKASIPALQYEQLRKAQQSLSAQAAVLAQALHQINILESLVQANACID